MTPSFRSLFWNLLGQSDASKSWPGVAGVVFPVRHPFLVIDTKTVSEGGDGVSVLLAEGEIPYVKVLLEAMRRLALWHHCDLAVFD
jgi:hypothetical protein